MWRTTLHPPHTAPLFHSHPSFTRTAPALAPLLYFPQEVINILISKFAVDADKLEAALPTLWARWDANGDVSTRRGSNQFHCMIAIST